MRGGGPAADRAAEAWACATIHSRGEQELATICVRLRTATKGLRGTHASKTNSATQHDLTVVAQVRRGALRNVEADRMGCPINTKRNQWSSSIQMRSLGMIRIPSIPGAPHLYPGRGRARFLSLP